MTILRVVPFVFLAVGLFGQTVDNAVPNPKVSIDQAVRAIGNISLGLQPKLAIPWISAATQPPLPEKPSTFVGACSVPLLEMTIPDRKNFVIGRVEPPSVNDHMSIAPRLPPCSSQAK
jgi:hypothetical protein